MSSVALFHRGGIGTRDTELLDRNIHAPAVGQLQGANPCRWNTPLENSCTLL